MVPLILSTHYPYVQGQTECWKSPIIPMYRGQTFVRWVQPIIPEYRGQSPI